MFLQCNISLIEIFFKLTQDALLNLDNKLVAEFHLWPISHNEIRAELWPIGLPTEDLLKSAMRRFFSEVSATHLIKLEIIVIGDI